MSKKVLILSSSPRKKGNSEILCDQFMKGAEEEGNQVEKISLREKNIHYCTVAAFVIPRINVCRQTKWRSSWERCLSPM